MKTATKIFVGTLAVAGLLAFAAVGIGVAHNMGFGHGWKGYGKDMHSVYGERGGHNSWGHGFFHH